MITEFRLALLAEGKSPKTVTIYTSAVRWLADTQHVTEWTDVTRKQVREHIAGILETRSASYASNQFRALQQFFKFLADEENVPDVMAGMKPPRVPEKLVPVLEPGMYDRLISTCAGRSFLDLRDKALFEMFRATGARRSEIANLNVTDIDLGQLCAIVTGKGSRMRVVRFDSACGLALARYLRVRGKHRYSGSPRLWVGMDGPLHADAVSLMFRRRCEQAGVKVNPHRFRHDFSHRYLANGGNEGDLMQQNGWSSSMMLRRYGASAAGERAREHYDKVMANRK